MDKYVLMKRFHHDFQVQVYIHVFVYVDPDKMVEEYYSPYIKNIVENCNKKSTPGPVPNRWLGFSYIGSKHYELDMKFYETEINRKEDSIPNKKYKTFCDSSDSDIFPTSLIKGAKLRFNQKLLYHNTQRSALTLLQ